MPRRCPQCTLCDAQLHLPPSRRPDAGPRAGPRRSLRTCGEARASFIRRTPLTLAETASVFGETIVFGRLLEEDSSPSSRLALLAENIEGALATVFRQVAMNRFEELVHTARREQGELSVRALWRAVVREPRGDVRRLGRDHRGLSQLVVLHPAFHRHRPATSMRTPMDSCSRYRSTSATSRAATSWSHVTSSCSPPAVRARRRSLARIVGHGSGRPRLLGCGPRPGRAPAAGGRRGCSRRWSRIETLPRRQGAIESSSMPVQGLKERAWRVGRNERTWGAGPRMSLRKVVPMTALRASTRARIASATTHS